MFIFYLICLLKICFCIKNEILLYFIFSVHRIMETEPRLLPLLPLVRQTAHDNHELWRAYNDSSDLTEDDESEIVEIQKAVEPSTI